MFGKAAKFARLCEGSALECCYAEKRKNLRRDDQSWAPSATNSPRRRLSKRQEGFWRAADTLGPAAVETFVKSPKQERRVNRLYDGSAEVPDYSGAAKKTAACAGMTL
jgi:hypothetical protein